MACQVRTRDKFRRKRSTQIHALGHIYKKQSKLRRYTSKNVTSIKFIPSTKAMDRYGNYNQDFSEHSFWRNLKEYSLERRKMHEASSDRKKGKMSHLMEDREERDKKRYGLLPSSKQSTENPIYSMWRRQRGTEPASNRPWDLRGSNHIHFDFFVIEWSSPWTYHYFSLKRIFL